MLRRNYYAEAFALAAATSCFVALAYPAHARSAYDGSWDLVFVTQRGACDPAYNFTVNVFNGVVTHPNLVRFRGYVAKSGAVRASVTVQDKYAAGSGRLSSASDVGYAPEVTNIRFRATCRDLPISDIARLLENERRPPTGLFGVALITFNGPPVN